MEVLRNLFEGYPNLWGGGVAHSVLILSLTIAFGIILAKIKVRGVSLGVTWILFVGIVFGHFNMNLDEHLLHFLKEFGLILFVYSIGLQVGPGFFSAFKKGGFTLNMLAVLVVALGVGITVILHFTTGTPITTMVGILSGAVTNTPGLGAAQQANSDLNGIDAPRYSIGICCQLSAGCRRHHPVIARLEISSAHQYRTGRKRSGSRLGTFTGTYRTSCLHRGKKRIGRRYQD